MAEHKRAYVAGSGKIRSETDEEYRERLKRPEPLAGMGGGGSGRVSYGSAGMSTINPDPTFGVSGPSAPNTTGPNYIKAATQPDGKHVILQMCIAGAVMGDWIEYDAEQLDGLIRLLQMRRDELK